MLVPGTLAESVRGLTETLTVQTISLLRGYSLPFPIPLKIPNLTNWILIIRRLKLR